MPYKPSKPCAYSGCRELTTSRYCDKHKKQTDSEYNKYDRDPATAKRYSGQWSKIRRAFLSAHPLCERCKTEGKLTPAVLVHHKRKLSDGGTHDTANLMALCDSCHSRLHTKQGDCF